MTSAGGAVACAGALLAALVLLAPLRTAGRPPSSPIERTLAIEPTQHTLDGNLNARYRAAQAMATATARAGLRTAQRTWLAERDATCPDATPACLEPIYQARIAELEALIATGTANDDKIVDPRPLRLVGSWEVLGVEDARGQVTDAASLATLQSTLAFADLPAVGRRFTAFAGSPCGNDAQCEPVGWRRTTLAETDGGAKLASALALPPDARAFVGSTGSIRSSLLVVPAANGNLRAVFMLCDAAARHCRDAWQIWRPASPDARMGPP